MHHICNFVRLFLIRTKTRHKNRTKNILKIFKNLKNMFFKNFYKKHKKLFTCMVLAWNISACGQQSVLCVMSSFVAFGSHNRFLLKLIQSDVFISLDQHIIN